MDAFMPDYAERRSRVHSPSQEAFFVGLHYEDLGALLDPKHDCPAGNWNDGAQPRRTLLRKYS